MPSLTETYVENREMILPNHANTLETAHGGTVLRFMDQVGAMSAMRFAREQCVTARMDEVNFKRPIPVGEIALVKAYVYGSGRTSVRVRTEVYREDPRTADTELTTESNIVFVAIDGEGRPTPVPDLTVESDRGRTLHERALATDGDRDAADGGDDGTEGGPNG
ncbi:MAG: acyl-CoA thioesterase [Haloarculaceae archaeon]